MHSDQVKNRQADDQAHLDQRRPLSASTLTASSSRSDIKQRIKNLRQSILAHVLSDRCESRHELIVTFCDDHSGRHNELTNTRQRIQDLETGKGEYKPTEDDVARKERALSTVRQKLRSVAQPLGTAAFRAHCGDELGSQPSFSDRLDAQERYDSLRGEFGSLEPAQGARVVDKTKAKARQAVVAVKMKLEEAGFRKLEAKIGARLLETQSEETVKCDRTESVLAQIRQARDDIAKQEGELAESTRNRDAERVRLQKSLEISAIDSSRTFDAEIARCKRVAGEKQKLLMQIETNLATTLLQDAPSDDSKLSSLLRELRMAETQLSGITPRYLQVVESMWGQLREQWLGLLFPQKAAAIAGTTILLLAGFLVLSDFLSPSSSTQQSADGDNVISVAALNNDKGQGDQKH